MTTHVPESYSTHRPDSHSHLPPRAQLAFGIALSETLLWLLENTQRTEEDKASHAIHGKAIESESVARRWLECGMRKLH